MTFLKPRRLPVLAGLLCLLLVGFAATSYGVVRWDVVPSPTEVITYGRSEVLGSISMFARGAGNITGTTLGGNAQIGIIFTNPSVQIDNTTSSGIHLWWSFANYGGPTNTTTLLTASQPSIVLVDNFDLNGRCTGRITINMPAGLNLVDGDFIRLEGVRGRIDQSLAITAGTDLSADLQSINDPAANLFTPDRVRVAKSFCPMFVKVTPDTLLLCFPSSGKPNAGAFTATSPGYGITVTEGFARAFVDMNASGNINKSRVDSAGNPLGAPTNNTQFMFWLQDIPASVSTIDWPTSVPSNEQPTISQLVRISTPVYDTTTGTASAIYEFRSINQTDISDITLESFKVRPTLFLATGATATGTVNAGVWLYPFGESATACANPSAVTARPRFLKVLKALATCNNPPDDPVQPYALVIRCNCYMLFTYVTSTPGATGFNTGIAVANTTGDTEVFGTALEAPNQLGKITFYFYDKAAGYVGSTVTASDILSGRSFVDLLSNILPTGVTSFSGYIISRADFQFCHGFAFIADNGFATVAQGYLANIIPDPAIKGAGGRRTASDAGDITNLPAGEGLNN